MTYFGFYSSTLDIYCYLLLSHFVYRESRSRAHRDKPIPRSLFIIKTQPFATWVPPNLKCAKLFPLWVFVFFQRASRNNNCGHLSPIKKLMISTIILCTPGNKKCILVSHDFENDLIGSQYKKKLRTPALTDC